MGGFGNSGHVDSPGWLQATRLHGFSFASGMPSIANAHAIKLRSKSEELQSQRNQDFCTHEIARVLSHESDDPPLRRYVNALGISARAPPLYGFWCTFSHHHRENRRHV
jgi:hypothetical protein